MELRALLEQLVRCGGSDMFIIPGSPAAIKIRGQLTRANDNILKPADTRTLVDEIYLLAGERSRDLLLQNGDDDFSLAVEKLARFRVNVYHQRGSLAATLRLVNFGLPDPDALLIPPQVMRQADIRSGMVLVTGPAGSGKSTTLACMVDRINQNHERHIITIEDPIEYIHPHKKSLVSQREIPTDASSFSRALRAALRQAPDVILLGEMRDNETIHTAMTAA